MTYTLQSLLAEFDKEFDLYLDEGERYEVKSFITNKITKLVKEAKEQTVITGETSDGYHTFNELYEFRKVFNATLFNEWSRQEKYSVHKSKKHSDGFR